MYQSTRDCAKLLGSPDLKGFRKSTGLTLSSLKCYIVKSLFRDCHWVYCPCSHTSTEMRSLGQSGPPPHNAMHKGGPLGLAG